MVDDMGTVGLQHVLKNTHGLGKIVLFVGLCSQLLVAEESRGQYFGMLTGYIVQVVRFQMARCQSQTVVNGTECILIAHHVGFVEGYRGFSLEEEQINLHRCIGSEFLAYCHGIIATIYMVEG